LNIKTGIYAIFFMVIAQVGVSVVNAMEAKAPAASISRESAALIQYEKSNEISSFDAIKFTHGDVSWLDEMALSVGWPAKQIPKLKKIVLRESGGCPNRIGSSIVDKNCNITGYTKATNKSDSGLLQINGVNWDPSRNKNAVACVQFGFCTQEDLLDPVNNLKVGRELFKLAGWDPWDPCAWGPEYAHRCKKGK
jgi:hypothetical protein